MEANHKSQMRLDLRIILVDAGLTFAKDSRTPCGCYKIEFFFEKKDSKVAILQPQSRGRLDNSASVLLDFLSLSWDLGKDNRSSFRGSNSLRSSILGESSQNGKFEYHGRESIGRSS